MDFDMIIPDLKARVATAQERLAGLRLARRPHALAAVSGDAKAKKAIAGIDAEVAAATAEGETLEVALEEAERLRAEAEVRAAEEDRQRREAEARKIAGEIAEASRKVDRAAERLAECLAQRESLIGKLAETGAAYPGLISALRRPSRINGAFWAAGLGRWGGLRHVVGTHQRPLAEADAIPAHLIRFARSDDDNTKMEAVR